MVVRTVLGDVPAETIGVTLFHEHLCCNFTRWSGDPDVDLTDVELVLDEVRLAGVDGLQTIVDATTPDIGGRDIRDIARIAGETGINVIAASGLYLEHTYPSTVRDLDEARLTERFIGEVTRGLDGTDICAGVLGEIGTSLDGISARELKTFRAAARAHVATGVAIITHTMEGKDAVKQLDILESAGAPPLRIAIGHLDCLNDPSVHRAIAERGAFLGFDRVGLSRYQPDVVRADNIVKLVDAGFADQVLLASDFTRRSRMKRNGGRGYAEVLTHFLPMLKERGIDDSTLRRMVVDNPRRLLAFSPREILQRRSQVHTEGEPKSQRG